jgi:hypothetical protein
VWAARNEHSQEYFDRLQKGREKHHKENRNLRPYREVLEPQANCLQFDLTPLHRADRRVACSGGKACLNKATLLNRRTAFRLPPPTKY